MPHGIPPTDGPRRKAVIVGAGPGGLEAARVLALRGHDVVLFEATDRVGGQIVLAAKVPARRDLIGIIDWRRSELERLGVRVRLNTLAEPTDVIAEDPDIVLVATGGVPDIDWVDGAEHCVSVWDILGGAPPAGKEVLIYDGTGDHSALSCAQFLAERGAAVELVTLDTTVGQEVGYLDRPFYLKSFFAQEVVTTVCRELVRVQPLNGRRLVVLRNEFTGREEERVCDVVVVERATVPSDMLYNELRPMSRNDGVTDLDALVSGRAQDTAENPAGRFQLFRVGDAVAARDIHAAIYDSLRLCKEL